MTLLRVRSVQLLEKASNPESGTIPVLVRLEQGSDTRFAASTIDQPGLWLNDADFAYSSPTVFVRKLDQASIEAAVGAMASEMSGYWLRYYNSPDSPSLIQGMSAGKIPPGSRVASVELADLDAPALAQTGVVEVRLKDGRLFSIQTSTPSEFSETFLRLGLPFFFGPQILFLREITAEHARAAAESMSQTGDRWLCIYDTPRMELPKILAEFKTKHAA